MIKLQADLNFRKSSCYLAVGLSLYPYIRLSSRDGFEGVGLKPRISRPERGRTGTAFESGVRLALHAISERRERVSLNAVVEPPYCFERA